MRCDERIEFFLNLPQVSSEIRASVHAVTLDFKGMALRSLKRMFLDCTPGKKLLNRFTFQRGREFIITNFLK